MSSSERNRQRKLAKKKAKRKAQKQHSATGVNTKAAYLERGLNAPLTDCMVYGSLELGMITVSLFRRISQDVGVAVGFCVDLYCLGVKDCFVRVRTRKQHEELIVARGDSRPMPPEDAKKMIEGAVEFARSYGLNPHRDYRKAMRYFHDVDSSESDAVFEFGRDGRPLFIQGPNDTPARCRQIMEAIARSTGKE